MTPSFSSLHSNLIAVIKVTSCNKQLCTKNPVGKLFPIRLLEDVFPASLWGESLLLYCWEKCMQRQQN